MSDTQASLATPPEGYGDWLADFKGHPRYPGDGTLMEEK